MEIKMDEMTKYSKWVEEDRRTIRSRGILLKREEMLRNGIIEVINYQVTLDDGMDDMEQMHEIVRQGLGQQRYFAFNSLGIVPVASMTKAVLVDRVDKEVPAGDGEMSFIRTYSGIVFHNEWFMHIYLLRREMLYPDLLIMPRLVN